MRTFQSLFILAAACQAVSALPSESAQRALAAHGIGSAAEAAALGLDAADLRAIGVDDVGDRVEILKQKLISSAQTRQDFHFVASYVNSTRQYGKCLQIVVNYRYPRGSYTDQSYIDYRDVRKLALHYAEPTDSMPIETQWELVNMAFVEATFAKWNITGISSQIQVMSSETPDIDEPGNHGSTVTHGDMEPLGEPWVNNFKYDCTKYSGPQQV